MLALSAWVRPASVLLPCRGASAQLHRFPVAVSTRRVNVSAEKLEFRAQCHPGLEEVVAQELMKAPVHARDVEYTAQKAGVDFSGSMETAYRACIRLRAALRVLHLLAVKYMDPSRRGYDELYAAVRAAAPWHEFLGRSGMTVAVQLRMRSCQGWNHSTAAQQCIQDAIADAVRDHGGEKPWRPAPGQQASLQLFVTMFQEEVKIYREVSGASLHRRGYRGVVHRAALNESAAAGLLYMSGWPEIAAQGGSLVDCMCGSGTILTEAALMAHNIAPGLLRKRWSLTEWHDFDAIAWENARDEAKREVQRNWNGVIAGCDIHPGALALAKQCVQAARVADSVYLNEGRCEDWKLPKTPDVVVTNPPWGVRLTGGYNGNMDMHHSHESALQASRSMDAYVDTWGAGTAESEGDHMESWQALSTFLKRECGGSTAWILCGDKSATKALRMKVGRRYPVTLGGVDCRLLRYEILPPRKLGDRLQRKDQPRRSQEQGRRSESRAVPL